MKIKDKRELFKNIVYFFLIGSFFGVLFESLLCYFQRGHFESRSGLIYGPFNAVYGIGFVVYMLILIKSKNIYTLFLKGMFLGGLVEYLSSLFQELIFGTVSWDYTRYFLNIDGRTSLFHVICWGIGGVLFVKWLYPSIVKLINLIPGKIELIITCFILIFMTFNISISWLASCRLRERSQNLPASNFVERFLDNNYSNEKMKKIYPNLKQRY